MWITATWEDRGTELVGRVGSVGIERIGRTEQRRMVGEVGEGVERGERAVV
jgi:hypothetical protein